MSLQIAKTAMFPMAVPLQRSQEALPAFDKMANDHPSSEISDLILMGRWPYPTTKTNFNPLASAQARREQQPSDISDMVLTSRWQHAAAANRTFGIYELTEKILSHVRDPILLFAMKMWNRNCNAIISDRPQFRQTMLLESSQSLPMFKLMKVVYSGDALNRAMHPFGIQSIYTMKHDGSFFKRSLNPGKTLVVTIDAPRPAMVQSEGSWRDIRIEYPGREVLVSLSATVDGISKTRTRCIEILMGERTTLGKIASACENRTARDCRFAIEGSIWEGESKGASREEEAEGGKYRVAWAMWAKEFVGDMGMTDEEFGIVCADLKWWF